ncbi:MAG: hypothetical protein II232_05820 [Spirochaetaceae bacterium]|nr:hypothetical protein [Spirochaetaceae bacterium]
MGNQSLAHYHLPGLFEFYDFYCEFLPLYRSHPEYFYHWCDIASIYGSPEDCLWGGGRTGSGNADAEDVLALMNEYKISPRLTFSNSLLTENHLAEKKCNLLCKLFEKSDAETGIIIHSDLLLDYLQKKYPAFYFVSSTTKVLTDFAHFQNELNRDEFSFVVPDFRLNKSFEKLNALSQTQKEKTEFLCNECCNFSCTERKVCYENVSRKNLGLDVVSHKCTAPDSEKGYRFSSAMKNPGFIGLDEIQNVYLSHGFSNFKIEGRGLGSAMLLEFLLYYMVKPEFQLEVREELYLDAMLDLF